MARHKLRMGDVCGKWGGHERSLCLEQPTDAAPFDVTSGQGLLTDLGMNMRPVEPIAQFCTAEIVSMDASARCQIDGLARSTCDER